jgi:hypothetical protein
MEHMAWNILSLYYQDEAETSPAGEQLVRNGLDSGK